MNLKHIKLVTFDVTNTLLSFRVPPWQYYASVARKYGYRGDAEHLRLRFLKSYKTMWTEYPNFGKDTIAWQDWWRKVVLLTLDEQILKTIELNEIADQLISEYKTTKCWSCCKGGLQLLKTFRDNGSVIGVISNFDPRLHDILHNLNIHNKFDFVLTSYETGFCKPDVKIFEEAAKKCKKPVKATESLHIGDNLKKDYIGAKSAGWHALLINNNIYTEAPPALKHVFKSLDELTLAIQSNMLELC